MGPGRFELPTSPLSGARSNQLSYEPIVEAGKYTFSEVKSESLLVSTLCFFGIFGGTIQDEITLKTLGENGARIKPILYIEEEVGV